MEYSKFIESKAFVNDSKGIKVKDSDIADYLYDFQKDILQWSLRKGRSAIFADCGLGKTPLQLEWSKVIHQKTGGDVLILAPLAVSIQTRREGEKFGVEVNVAATQDDIKPGINITNYEKLHHFNADEFAAVVLDESSILKNYSGKRRNEIINAFASTPYKLACTATPSPNDYMELGSHSEFIGAMRSSEMLSAFFINNTQEVGKYRLKGHGETPFWKWMASWAVMIRKPSDLGYNDGAFQLPPLTLHEHVVHADNPMEGMLFAVDAHTMSERRAARRASLEVRVDEVIARANDSNEAWLIWCDLNKESALLTKGINDAVEVKGADKDEHKETSLFGFAKGAFRVLVSKPSIAGWGMNYQHCRNMAFTGLSDSYEQFYQATRRCWRFGQTKEVHCHIVTDRSEGAVVANVKRKEKNAELMAQAMTRHMQYISKQELHNAASFAKTYNPETEMETPAWAIV